MFLAYDIVLVYLVRHLVGLEAMDGVAKTGHVHKTETSPQHRYITALQLAVQQICSHPPLIDCKYKLSLASGLQPVAEGISAPMYIYRDSELYLIPTQQSRLMVKQKLGFSVGKQVVSRRTIVEHDPNSPVRQETPRPKVSHYYCQKQRKPCKSWTMCYGVSSCSGCKPHIFGSDSRLKARTACPNVGSVVCLGWSLGEGWHF